MYVHFFFVIFKCFIRVKSQFREKIWYFRLRNFRLLYNTSLSNFRSIICQVAAYGRLKTKENFKLLALKVVAVAYEGFQI